VFGEHQDSRKACWNAIGAGGDIIVEIQRLAQDQASWTSLRDVLPRVSPVARKILSMRQEALAKFKQASHHRHGYRLSAWTNASHPRPVNSLCLISGHEGQEIPGLVRHDRVVVDAEHMEQALGPATVTELLDIRRKIGEHVYISTNVSETTQIVRNPKTGRIDSRSTAALTATKILAAVGAGADVVKVGFAHLDEYKRDLRSDEALRQMKLVRLEIDRAVKAGAVVTPLNKTTRFPLVAVFFPEIGIDSHGEQPFEIAEKGISLAAYGGWQGVLLDTFEKFTGRRYVDFYDTAETKRLAALAHKKGIELWIAGSIAVPEVEPLVRCKVDLICFGGAARNRSGQREELVHGRPDKSIKRPLVEELVRAFERADQRPRS
jgi:hypothetical protein